MQWDSMESEKETNFVCKYVTVKMEALMYLYTLLNLKLYCLRDKNM